MRVKEIAEMILRGTDDGLTSSEIGMDIATAINDKWYLAPKAPGEVVIEE